MASGSRGLRFGGATGVCQVPVALPQAALSSPPAGGSCQLWELSVVVSSGDASGVSPPSLPVVSVEAPLPQHGPRRVPSPPRIPALSSAVPAPEHLGGSPNSAASLVMVTGSSSSSVATAIPRPGLLRVLLVVSRVLLCPPPRAPCLGVGAALEGDLQRQSEAEGTLPDGHPVSAWALRTGRPPRFKARCWPPGWTADCAGARLVPLHPSSGLSAQTQVIQQGP